MNNISVADAVLNSIKSVYVVQMLFKGVNNNLADVIKVNKQITFTFIIYVYNAFL